jgi:excinuclease ABC subunit C
MKLNVVNLGMMDYKEALDIQEEVHRQAIGFHKQRTSSKLKTGLEEVPGLGKVRIRNLLRTYKTTARLKEATLDELLTVDGMNRKAAEELLRYFGKEG